jgi:hypothetical protein
VCYSFSECGSCRGGREFETTEFILHRVAADLSDYMRAKQEEKVTGKCSQPSTSTPVLCGRETY